uniref:Cytochrome P450 n=1 Tax=Timema monikensis TaxID=170555 RepID=A0A7R9EBE9_9NEOP|nr:unnamed protein product [Timema monikensis]
MQLHTIQQGGFSWVLDQDDVETILKSKKCIDRKFFKDILDKIGIGDSLITTSGEKWASHRKVILPTFKLSVLRNFISVFQIKSFELVENWASMAKGSEMDIFLELCNSSLQMTCSTLLGVNIEHNIKSLLSESPVLSEKEIQNETLFMIIGGYETTATLISFATMLLAFHPEIQNKAFQELSDIFGNDQRRPATLQDF